MLGFFVVSHKNYKNMLYRKIKALWMYIISWNTNNILFKITFQEFISWFIVSSILFFAGFCFTTTLFVYYEHLPAFLSNIDLNDIKESIWSCYKNFSKSFKRNPYTSSESEEAENLITDIIEKSDELSKMDLYSSDDPLVDSASENKERRDRRKIALGFAVIVIYSGYKLWTK